MRPSGGDGGGDDAATTWFRLGDGFGNYMQYAYREELEFHSRKTIVYGILHSFGINISSLSEAEFVNHLTFETNMELLEAAKLREDAAAASLRSVEERAESCRARCEARKRSRSSGEREQPKPAQPAEGVTEDVD